MLAALVLSAAGCGSDPAPRAMRAPPPVDASGPLMPREQPPEPDRALFAPPGVPRHGHGRADPAAVRVIRGWLAALRHGEIARAASYFAVPTRFQNGTPVMTLRTRFAVRVVVGDLPCGAVATRFQGAGRYTLVRFRLTERAHADCRGAAGHTTGGAILVSGGRIRAWYRLYDEDEIQPGPPQIDPGRQAA